MAARFTAPIMRTTHNRKETKMNFMDKPTNDLVVRDAIIVSVVTVAITTTVTIAATVVGTMVKEAIKSRAQKKVIKDLVENK